MFGGEDGSFDPTLGVVATPEYGKVFISVKTTSGQNLTTAQKNNLILELKPYIVASITPVFVDPETIFITPTVTFVYDPNLTTKTSDAIQTTVLTAIRNYNNTNLKSFTGQYRSSELSRLVDTSERSILNSNASIKLSKNLVPDLGLNRSYVVNFNNPILHPQDGYLASTGGMLSSTTFYVGDDTTTIYQFDDDGFGNLRRFTFVGTTRSYVDSTAGTINYETGNISINNLQINSVGLVDNAPSRFIRFTITPRYPDVVPVRNQILEIDTTNFVVNGIVDQRATSGTNTVVTGSGTTTTTTTTTSGGTTTSTSTNY